MTQTPLCDEHARLLHVLFDTVPADGSINTEYVPADLARNLERQLSECQTALALMEKDRDHFFQLSGKYLEQLSQAEAALREAQKDAELWKDECAEAQGALREMELRWCEYTGSHLTDAEYIRLLNDVISAWAMNDLEGRAALAEKGDKGG